MKCSGINGSVYKVMKSFVCRGCMNPVTSTGSTIGVNANVELVTGTNHTSVCIVVSANLELMDKFSYLGDMLSIDGDADAAVEIRIRIGWNKFRQLVPLLTNKDISLIVVVVVVVRAIVQQLCMK